MPRHTPDVPWFRVLLPPLPPSPPKDHHAQWALKRIARLEFEARRHATLSRHYASQADYHHRKPSQGTP